MNRKLTIDKIDSFKLHLFEEERSRVTIEKYCRDITKFDLFAGDQKITKEVVIAYKQYLVEGGYAERSINSMLAAINSLFNYLEWYDCKVKSIKLAPEIYRPDEKELTLKEYQRLVKTAMEQGKEKTALILQTICGMGIRISELKFITVEAVKRGEARVNCKGKVRKVFIIDNLKTLLLNYIRKNKIKTGTIFLSRSGKPLNRTTVWREMKNLCEAAKVNPSKVFPHNLRHLFARVFYKLEKDIAKLAQLTALCAPMAKSTAFPHPITIRSVK